MKKALPIAGVDDKFEVNFTIACLIRKGLVAHGPRHLANYVLDATAKSATIAEVRSKLHLAIMELTKVMELTM